MALADIASGSASQLRIITISLKNGPSVMIDPERPARPIRVQGLRVYETTRQGGLPFTPPGRRAGPLAAPADRYGAFPAGTRLTPPPERPCAVAHRVQAASPEGAQNII